MRKAAILLLIFSGWASAFGKAGEVYEKLLHLEPAFNWIREQSLP